jgi:hypothetical protein
MWQANVGVNGVQDSPRAGLRVQADIKILDYVICLRI